MLQASFHAKYPWVGVDEIKWTKCGSLLMLRMGTWSLLYCSIFVNVNFFFPHNKLKKKNTTQDVILFLFVWRAPCGELWLWTPRGSPQALVPMWMRRDETPEQFRDVLVSQGCYTAFCEPRGEDHRNLFPNSEGLQVWTRGVSSFSLGHQGRILLASSSWQSLGFLAARLHPSNLCLCYHVASPRLSLRVVFLCVSVSSFLILDSPRTHP